MPKKLKKYFTKNKLCDILNLRHNLDIKGDLVFCVGEFCAHGLFWLNKILQKEHLYSGKNAALYDALGVALRLSLTKK